MEANLDFSTPAAILLSQLAQLSNALENPPSLLLEDIDVKDTYLNDLKVVQVADILKYAVKELDNKKKNAKKTEKGKKNEKVDPKDDRKFVNSLCFARDRYIFFCILFFFHVTCLSVQLLHTTSRTWGNSQRTASLL